MTPGVLRAVQFVTSLLLFLMLILTAYVCDDAYITFRSIDNLLNGFGLTFNPTERVLAFTNPLWAFAHVPLAYFSGEFFYTTIFLSLLATCLTVYLSYRFLESVGFTIFLLILVSSKAFIDFSSSGLENPLAHLLAVALVVVSHRRDLDPMVVLRRSALLASLLALNRLDLALIAAPVLVTLCLDARGRLDAKRLRTAILWGSPVLVWLAFCLFYYGSPFPNTLYAKVWGTGIPRAEYLDRGLSYYALTLRLDPFSLAAIAAGIAAALWRRERVALALAAGVALYLLYVVFHGSDQMVPRFFSTPTVVAALLIGRAFGQSEATLPGSTRHAFAAAAATIVVSNLALPYVPIKCLSPSYSITNRNEQIHRGMSDFRATWSLNRLVNHDWREKKFPRANIKSHEIRVMPAIGIRSFVRGPNSYTLDCYALADPLLARLPSSRPPGPESWTPGHVHRNLPLGYVESLHYGENRIENPGLRAYYEVIREITRDDLFSLSRLATILRFNLGAYDAHLERYDPTSGINVTEPADLKKMIQTDREFLDFTIRPRERTRSRTGTGFGRRVGREANRERPAPPGRPLTIGDRGQQSD